MLSWREGEDLVAEYLKGKGWKILVRNFRTRRGEVDIIATIDSTLAFVEVKTWGLAVMNDVEYSVNRRKIKTYTYLSRYFIYTHREYDDYFVRYDLAYVDASGGRLKYLENAFTENG